MHRLSAFIRLVIPHSQRAEHQRRGRILFADGWCFWCLGRARCVQCEVTERPIHFQWCAWLIGLHFLLELRNGRLIFLVCILQIQYFLSKENSENKKTFVWFNGNLAYILQLLVLFFKIVNLLSALLLRGQSLVLFNSLIGELFNILNFLFQIGDLMKINKLFK